MFTSGFTQPQQFAEAWAKSAREQLGRMESLSAQMQKLHGQQIEKAQELIDESAKLMKESLSYAHALGLEWQKLTLETMKSATNTATGG